MPNCCPTDLKPVTSDYERKAVSYYLAGIENAAAGKKKGIIIVTDIWGLHPNAYQLADVLAAAGFIVAVPDFFAEKGAWSLTNYPPKDGFDGAEWMEFQGRLVNFEKHHVVLAAARDVLTKLGAEKVGAIGMCWGGKVMMSSTPKNILDAFVAPHPSFFDENDGKDVKIPVLVLPSKDEDEKVMAAVAANLQQSNAKSGQKRYDALNHGFLGARGGVPTAADYGDAETKAQAQDALDTAIAFLNENL